MAFWQAFFFSAPGLVFVASYGAVLGSFLNVVAYRLPRGLSTVAPRSRCPRCCSPIRPWHNLPILGWLSLGGRCLDCRGPISPRYPLVEAVTAALFVFSFLSQPTFERALFSCAVCAWALVLALIDFDLRVLPDALTLPAIPLFLAIQLQLFGKQAFAAAVVASLLGWLGLSLVSALWRIWRREDGLGTGDARFAAALGACFGGQGLLLVLALAGLVAIALAGILALTLRPGDPRRGRLPFGSALGLASLALLLLVPTPGAWP